MSGAKLRMACDCEAVNDVMRDLAYLWFVLVTRVTDG